MLKNNIIIITITLGVFATTPSLASSESSDLALSSMHHVETESKMHDLMDTDHGKIYGLGQRDDYKNVPPLTDEEISKHKEWHPQMHQHYHGATDDTDKE